MVRIMQELDYPIRILERGPDDFCILVPHDSLTYWKDKERKEKANKTRAFCNWLRKTFPHVPTEFRYVNTKQVRVGRGSYWSRRRFKTVNCDKHFVAYGLKGSELMMVKLAWQFTSQPCRLKTATHPDPSAYAIEAPAGFRPSDALVKRIENKTKAKPVRTA
jgi:hypothetical protein